MTNSLSKQELINRNKIIRNIALVSLNNLDVDKLLNMVPNNEYLIYSIINDDTLPNDQIRGLAANLLITYVTNGDVIPEVLEEYKEIVENILNHPNHHVRIGAIRGFNNTMNLIGIAQFICDDNETVRETVKDLLEEYQEMLLIAKELLEDEEGEEKEGEDESDGSKITR